MVLSSSSYRPSLIDPHCSHSRRLYGRDEELRILKNSFQRASSCVGSSPNDEGNAATTCVTDSGLTDGGGCGIDVVERVFVSGVSGSGKTALVEQAFGGSSSSSLTSLPPLPSTVSIRGTGKFEQQPNPKPFATLASALSEICRQILPGCTLDRESTIGDGDSFCTLPEDVGVARDELSRSNHSISDNEYELILKQQLRDDDIVTLSSILPELTQLLSQQEQYPEAYGSDGEDSSTNDPRRPSWGGGSVGLDKLKYTLRQFLRAITTTVPSNVITLCLDDLHWIDSTSLDILKFLLSDHELPSNLIFVGMYRDNEVSADHPLMGWITELDIDSRTCLTQISIGDLSLESIGSYLKDLFKIYDNSPKEEDKVMQLARLVESRTHGNIFHIHQLIDYMYNENLLQYSSIDSSWTWDLEVLKMETSLAENVIQVLGAKLHRLSQETQVFLQFCACLGFSFHLGDIQRIQVQQEQANNKQDQEVLLLEGMEFQNSKSCIETAVKQGILERLGRNRIKFVHDKIYQATLDMLDETSRQKIHLWIGKALYAAKKAKKKEDNNDNNLFLLVDQLNRGSQLLDKDDESDCSLLKDLCRLNCTAGKRAARLHAYFPSSDYLQKGIALLDPSTCWSEPEEYNLTLELYSSLAEALCSTGQLERQESVAATVLEHSRTTTDRLRAYYTILQSSLSQAKYDVNIDTSWQLLRELGQSDFPDDPSERVTRKTFERAKRKLQSKTDDELLAMAETQDAHNAAAIKVMCEMDINCHHLGRKQLGLFALSRAAELTLDYGLTKDAPRIFGALGQWCSCDNDVEMAYRCSKISLALLNRFGERAARISSPVIFSNLSICHWREPISILVDQSLVGYKAGMRAGVTSSAFLNVNYYVLYYVWSGLPLPPLESDTYNFLELMLEYGQTMNLLQIVNVYQLALNLMGKSGDILVMSGEGTALTRYRKKVGWPNRAGEQAEWSMTMQLYCFCEEFDMAGDMYDKISSVDMGFFSGTYLYHVRVFYFAIVAMQRAKKSGRRKDIKEAQKHFRKIESWVVENRALNLSHKLLILRAEHLTLSTGRKKKVKDDTLKLAFDEAITASTKAGFLNAAGLAALLASRAVEDTSLRRDYLRRACESYSNWGAVGVVEHLQMKYETLLADTRDGGSSSLLAVELNEGTTTSSGFRSRERFDDSIVHEHRSISQKNLMTSPTNNTKGHLKGFGGWLSSLKSVPLQVQNLSYDVK